MSEFETTYARHKEICAKINSLNKTALFDALARVGITTVHVDFDGEGDSGQISDIAALTADQPAQLPEAHITIQQVHFGQTEPTASKFTLEAAIEAICYYYLEQEHGGWENNEGGYGEFRFDVPTRTIELEFNGRYTEVATSTHTF